MPLQGALTALLATPKSSVTPCSGNSKEVTQEAEPLYTRHCTAWEGRRGGGRVGGGFPTPLGLQSQSLSTGMKQNSETKLTQGSEVKKQSINWASNTEFLARAQLR